MSRMNSPANRLPRMEEIPRDTEAATRREVKKSNRQPHSGNEETFSYVIFGSIVGSLIMAIIGLSKIAWKVDDGSYESFGVVEVHMDSDTHKLETMGLVWSVYTASRNGLAFTIMGILFSVYALYKIFQFITDSKGDIVYVLKLSFLCSFFYLFAIMLYGSLFPQHPFKGDLFYYTLGSNFTKWSDQAYTGGDQQQFVTQGSISSNMQRQTLGYTSNIDYDVATLASRPQHDAPLLFHPDPSHTSSLQSLSRWLGGDMTAPTPTVAVTSPIHSVPPFIRPTFRNLADAPAFPTPGSSTSSGSSSSSSSGVPSFPDPTTTGGGSSNSGNTGSSSGSSGSSGSVDYETTSASAQQQQFYARMAWLHVNTIWTFGTSYWLVMSAALFTVCWPIFYILYLFGEWVYEQHKSHEVQQKEIIPIIVVLACAWMLAVIGFASRYWKYARGTDSGNHFGLDQLVINGHRWPVATFSFDEKESRIHQASAVGLSFGILGIITGCITWVLCILHVYDKDREWTLPFVMCNITTGLWLIALVGYGATFPHYIGSEYFEFGYSFWLVLTAACVFFLPLLAFLGYLIYERAVETTREERIMSIPTSMMLLSLIFSMAAMGSDYWLVSTQKRWEGDDQHLGLMQGRLSGEWVYWSTFADLSTNLSSASLGTLVLLLCNMAIQVPVVIMGMVFICGKHEICVRQMPLVNTALSISTFFIQLIAIVAYAIIIPFSALPDGYHLSHSWRVQICACFFSFISLIGFGAVSKPPEPGERNVLAEAVTK